jgi:hypothetical protein
LVPTGRIDFSNGQAVDNFILQIEDTRIIQGIGGVDMTADLITNSRRKADLGSEEHKDHPGNEPATENPPR